jgi:hypothetical protein
MRDIAAAAQRRSICRSSNIGSHDFWPKNWIREDLELGLADDSLATYRRTRFARIGLLFPHKCWLSWSKMNNHSHSQGDGRADNTVWQIAKPCRCDFESPSPGHSLVHALEIMSAWLFDLLTVLACGSWVAYRELPCLSPAVLNQNRIGTKEGEKFIHSSPVDCPHAGNRREKRKAYLCHPRMVRCWRAVCKWNCDSSLPRLTFSQCAGHGNHFIISIYCITRIVKRTGTPRLPSTGHSYF